MTFETNAPPRLTKSETDLVQGIERNLTHICEVDEIKDDVQKVTSLIKGNWELLLTFSRGPINDGKQPITYVVGRSK